MATGTHPTCIAGLDLALKLVRRGSDPEIARCAAAVALDCCHRDNCCNNEACSSRLAAIEALLLRPVTDALPNLGH